MGPWLMKSSQSNFNLRSPSSYLARSYLIATVSKCMVLFSVWPLCARFCFLLLLLLLLDPLLYLVKRWKKFCKTYHLKDKEREGVCELKFRYSEKAKNLFDVPFDIFHAPWMILQYSLVLKTFLSPSQKTWTLRS